MFVTGKEKDAFEEAKSRRAWLYEKWNIHFESLDNKQRSIYVVPPESKLPQIPVKPSFFFQFWAQTLRAGIVEWRNSQSKLIDTLILVGATILITATDGVPVMTRASDPNISFENLVSPTQDTMQSSVKQLFLYAAKPQWQ